MTCARAKVHTPASSFNGEAVHFDQLANNPTLIMNVGLFAPFDGIKANTKFAPTLVRHQGVFYFAFSFNTEIENGGA